MRKYKVLCCSLCLFISLPVFGNQQIDGMQPLPSLNSMPSDAMQQNAQIPSLSSLPPIGAQQNNQIAQPYAMQNNVQQNNMQQMPNNNVSQSQSEANNQYVRNILNNLLKISANRRKQAESNNGSSEGNNVVGNSVVSQKGNVNNIGNIRAVSEVTNNGQNQSMINGQNQSTMIDQNLKSDLIKLQAGLNEISKNSGGIPGVGNTPNNVKKIDKKLERKLVKLQEILNEISESFGGVEGIGNIDVSKVKSENKKTKNTKKKTNRRKRSRSSKRSENRNYYTVKSMASNYNQYVPVYYNSSGGSSSGNYKIKHWGTKKVSSTNEQAVNDNTYFNNRCNCGKGCSCGNH